MSFKIYSAKNLPREKWSRLTDDSFYFSPEFASIWNTKGGCEVFLADESKDGFKAGLPGVVFGKSPLKRFQSMPDGFRGGPKYAPESSEKDRLEFLGQAEKWLKKNGIIRADINNPDEELKSSFFKMEAAFYHAVDLDNEPFVPLRREVRKQVRAAKRRDGEISLMNDEKDLEAFYRLVLETEERHNVKPWYPMEFFRRLLIMSKQDKRILWPVVIAEDNIIASRICFIEASQLFMWQAYSARKYTLLKPEYLLIDYIINYALENGLKSVSFGWTPPGVQTLVDFKERWGATRRTMKIYTYISRLGKILYLVRK